MNLRFHSLKALAALCVVVAIGMATPPTAQLAANAVVDPGTPTLDLLLPDAAQFPGPRPAVVIVHGGGWARGDKADQREKLTAKALTERGYAAISINYALFTYRDGPWKGPQTYDAWPRNVNDVVSVLSWITRKGTDHRIDPERVALLGYSAGAHLALLAAYGKDQDIIRGRIQLKDIPSIRAVVAVYGTHDLAQFGANIFERGAQPDEKRSIVASPITYLHAKQPPTLVIHGDADTTIPVSLAHDFATKLAEKNILHELVIVPGARHGFALGTPNAGESTDALFRFLSTYLD
jgi:acetyl esterase/lipase